MIKLQDLTPNIYYQQSRDFQFIARLFDLILNSSKTNIEIMQNLPLNDNTAENLIDLLSMTLGFKSRHEYNIKQLKAICSTLTLLLRMKGTLKAIQIAGNTLAHAEGSKQEVRVTTDLQDPYHIKIIVPVELTDLNLFNDLLIYILPAGITYELIRENQFSKRAQTNIIVLAKDMHLINDQSKQIFDLNAGSIIPQITNDNKENLIAAKASHLEDSVWKGTEGLMVNSGIYRIKESSIETENNNLKETTNGKYNK